MLIEEGLRARGMGGLVVPGTCGCIMGDLSPGNCLSDVCEGGHKHTHSKTGEWIVSTKAEGVTDADIEQCIAECG